MDTNHRGSGHGACRRGRGRGRGRAHRPSVPDSTPRSNSHVATEHRRRRLDVITRNRSRGNEASTT